MAHRSVADAYHSLIQVQVFTPYQLEVVANFLEAMQSATLKEIQALLPDPRDTETPDVEELSQ